MRLTPDRRLFGACRTWARSARGRRRRRTIALWRESRGGHRCRLRVAANRPGPIERHDDEQDDQPTMSRTPIPPSSHRNSRRRCACVVSSAIVGALNSNLARPGAQLGRRSGPVLYKASSRTARRLEPAVRRREQGPDPRGLATDCLSDEPRELHRQAAPAHGAPGRGSPGRPPQLQPERPGAQHQVGVQEFVSGRPSARVHDALVASQTGSPEVRMAPQPSLTLAR